jgi:hypothetical protein
MQRPWRTSALLLLLLMMMLSATVFGSMHAYAVSWDA